MQPDIPNLESFCFPVDAAAPKLQAPLLGQNYRNEGIVLTRNEVIATIAGEECDIIDQIEAKNAALMRLLQHTSQYVI